MLQPGKMCILSTTAPEKTMRNALLKHTGISRSLGPLALPVWWRSSCSPRPSWPLIALSCWGRTDWASLDPHERLSVWWPNPRDGPAIATRLGWHQLHTHTHTHTCLFFGLRGLSIGVMVFILYNLYVLLPYTYPTPKLSPHRRLCAFLNFQKNTI